MPAWFSKDIEYWKPEQPPPTTPMRRPAGSGSCVAMISRTFSAAVAERVRGALLICGVWTVSGVATVVAMNDLLILRKLVI
jgi:hypothetical protein